MILVDTTVWIDHLRAKEPCLAKNLRAGLVLMHPMIVGEVACGNLPRRAETLRKMRSLPGIDKLSHELVCSRIETLPLNGRGIGFVDAHLICSVMEYVGARLWTRDKRMKKVANDFGVAYAEDC